MSIALLTVKCYSKGVDFYQQSKLVAYKRLLLLPLLKMADKKSTHNNETEDYEFEF